MTLRFGTDGVRGVANSELTPELVLALGRATARVLGGAATTVTVGRDTRRSGPSVEAALVAGITSEGVDVELVGVVPTPAVALLSSRERTIGAVVSASHNGFADNGVKLFAPGGRKLTDDQEQALEAELHRLVDSPAADPDTPTGPGVGEVRSRQDGVEGHVAALVASLEGRRLDGLHVVVDCANGAAHRVGPEALRGLGATVTVLADQPDGTNINLGCGSTDPAALQAVVTEVGADAGLALDGDADRVVAVDAQGRLVDGDRLMAICALDLRARGRLRGDTVVVTVMTNLGFRRAMTEHGIGVEVVEVGDRNVLAALDAGGYGLGGEQSGHVVFPELSTTGDGLLTGIQLLDVVARTGVVLAELADRAMYRLPQVLRNVRVPDAAAATAAVAAEVESVRVALGDRGRVLVRPSGTEPVVRVMVEAPTEAEAEAACAVLTGALGAVVGPPVPSPAP